MTLMSDEETLRRAIQQIDAMSPAYMALSAESWRAVPSWALDAVMKAARKQFEPPLSWMPIDAWLEGREA